MAICRRCGNQMADTAAACPACGELRYQQPVAAPQQPQPQYATPAQPQYPPQQAYGAPQAAYPGVGQQQPQYAIPVTADEARGFFGALFDLSFTSFITTKLIKFIYIVLLVISALGAMGLIIGGFSRGSGAGLLFLVLSPVVFILYVIGARMFLESLINAFRITELLGELVKLNKR